jgi:hypothetical protein
VLFNAHSPALAKAHATLSPSSHAWVNYDEEKMKRVFFSNMAAAKGTRMHEIGHRLISERVNLPEDGKTLSLYVNDAIGYQMQSEVMLFYSDNCFGTADCVGFKRNKLRIHDLKTGNGAVTMLQLVIYAAIFCLEYRFTPLEIEIELRIYQNNKVVVHIPEPHEIFSVMDKIKTRDAELTRYRMGG